MSDVDVNETLLRTLQTQWPKFEDHGSQYWNVAARTVSKFDTTSRVKLRLLGLDYPGLADKVIHSPVVLKEASFKNPTGASITETVNYGRRYTDSYEWSITAGIKIGAAAKFTAGLPLVGEGEVSTSVELSFSGGFKNTKSEEVSFTGSVQIQVPAQTSVKAKAILALSKVDAIPFRATLQAYGQVGAYTAYSAGQAGPGDFSWQWSDLDTGEGWTNPGFKNVRALKDDSVRKFVVDGVFSADLGYNVDVVVVPLGALAAAA
jgi:hypothetical protein